MQGLYASAAVIGGQAQQFLDANRRALKPFVPEPLRAKLDTAVDDLERHRLAQAAAIEGAIRETARQADYRRNINDAFIRPIKAIARIALRRSAQFPGLMRQLPGRPRLFVSNMRAFASAAEKESSTLVAYGMPADFVEQLGIMLGRLVESERSRDRFICQRTMATAGLAAPNKSTRSIVGVLNAVMQPKLKRDAALLAAWKAARKAAQSPTHQEI